jgi:hypothetical protein
LNGADDAFHFSQMRERTSGHFVVLICNLVTVCNLAYSVENATFGQRRSEHCVIKSMRRSARRHSTWTAFSRSSAPQSARNWCGPTKRNPRSSD